jgi:transketolase
MALEDIAITRVLPNLTVVTPCDYIETKKAVKAIANYPWPVYLRLFREPSDILTKESDSFEIGKASVLQQGNDVTIIGCGPILAEAVKASEGLSCEIINLSTIKPLDKETILKSVRKTKRVITVEEHQIAGGLGSAVCEMLAGEFPVPVTMIGIKDSFTESGNYREIMDKYELTAKHIAAKIQEVLG